MSIRILLHHVLVKIPPAETTSSGGIVIPTARDCYTNSSC